MGITVKVGPDDEVVIDAPPETLAPDLKDIEVEVTQEDIENAVSGRDMIRRGVERALVRRLLD